MDTKIMAEHYTKKELLGEQLMLHQEASFLKLFLLL